MFTKCLLLLCISFALYVLHVTAAVTKPPAQLPTNLAERYKDLGMVGKYRAISSYKTLANMCAVTPNLDPCAKKDETAPSSRSPYLMCKRDDAGICGPNPEHHMVKEFRQLEQQCLEHTTQDKCKTTPVCQWGVDQPQKCTVNKDVDIKQHLGIKFNGTDPTSLANNFDPSKLSRFNQMRERLGEARSAGIAPTADNTAPENPRFPKIAGFKPGGAGPESTLAKQNSERFAKQRQMMKEHLEKRAKVNNAKKDGPIHSEL